MPLYAYECQACGARMELRQGIAEPARVRCPACHRHKLRRVIGPVTVSVPTPTSEARRGRGKG